uniref:GPI transamidase subunit PIG-U n=1 Tax=Ciona savignyi TaxID=51511 RepID=H2ZLS6_CIOSA
MSKLLFVLSCGVLLRAWLLQLKDLTTWISKRPEISTPQTSWNRLIEGFTISKYSSNVHEGDSYHGSTLLSSLLLHLHTMSPIVIPFIFIVCDVVATLALYNFAKTFLRKELEDQNNHKEMLATGVDSILLKNHHVNNVPMLIATVYILNPFTIVTCVSQSSVAFNNLFLALFTSQLVAGNILTTTLFLALATYETFYPIQLITVAVLCMHKYKETSGALIKTLVCFTMWMVVLFGVSYLQEGALDSIFAH